MRIDATFKRLKLRQGTTQALRVMKAVACPSEYSPCSLAGSQLETMAQSVSSPVDALPPHESLAGLEARDTAQRPLACALGLPGLELPKARLPCFRTVRSTPHGEVANFARKG